MQAQLLIHRSGLIEDAADVHSANIVLASLNNYPPGSSSHYNNLNYYILRLFIERVSGQPYFQYVQKHVLKPAGSDDMSVKSPWVPSWDATDFAGAIGWHASCSDLTALLHAISDGKVISKTSAEEMFHESLGWDPVMLNCQVIGYSKSGEWNENNGQSQTSEVGHFVDGVDVALLINSKTISQAHLLVEAWQLDKSGKLFRLSRSSGF